MIDQPDLFSGPLARLEDPDTSHEAAASITPGRTERMILAVVRVGDELTDDEIAARLPDCYPPTVKSARSRLTDAGELVATGEFRLSLRGRRSTVWRRVSV